ncbi:hypothetical protein RNJ44_04371 [Nakaseomyces bracarensis]|uniref:THO complex subunit 2 n=1 Tax=Nakaseomyces bracarensis TaxID=273131 RepID=A0ABR4NUQ2_9SACH
MPSLEQLKKVTLQVKSSLRTREYLTDEFVAQWDDKVHALVSNYVDLSSDQERETWLRVLFTDVVILLSSIDTLNVSVEKLSLLVQDVNNATPSLEGTIGKMFVAVTSSNLVKDPNEKILDFIRATPCLHNEVYKYSWLAARLMTRQQKVLLKHVLKKNKYEIKKYNLVWESPIGFAEIISLLYTMFLDPYASQRIPLYISQFNQISGKYNLDHLRTLDIVLSISAEHITENYQLIIDFLKSSNFWPKHTMTSNVNDFSSLNTGGNFMASNLITVRLNSFFQSHTESSNNEYERNYMNLCCILIINGFVNFVSLWDNLLPSEEDFNNYLDKNTVHLEEESTKGVENPLAMAAALTNDEEEISEKVEGKQDVTTSGDDKQIDIENQEQEKKRQQYAIVNSGKLQLLMRLLAHGVYIPAMWAISKHPKIVYLETEIPYLFTRIFDFQLEKLYSSAIPNWNSDINSASRQGELENGLLAFKPRLFSEIITDDTKEITELNTKRVFYYKQWKDSLVPIEDIDSLFNASHEYFQLFNVTLACNKQLITKICRIIKKGIQNDLASTTYTEESLDTWINYTRKFLFPITGVLENDSVLSSEIYDVMKNFPFEKRYFMYNEMLTKTSQDELLIKVGFNRAEREAKSTLKSLSTDNIESGSRKFSRLISSNPMATLVPIVKQIENYDKVSELIVYTTKFLNEFGYDTLQYVLLLRLTFNRPSVQDDGINQAMWVQRLAVFIAGLAKSCPHMDISKLITYLIKTLHKGNDIAVTILKELISTVAGIRDLNHVSRLRLILINSGKPLEQYGQKLIFDTRNDNKNLAMNLMKLFESQDAVTEIIMLLYNLNLQTNSKQLHYKILSSRCDEMNTLLWSFIELVKHCTNFESFSKVVTPFEKLVNDMGVSTPWAFHIWREYYKELDEMNAEVSSIEAFQNVNFEGVDFSHLDRGLFLSFWRLSLYHIQFDKSLYNMRKTEVENEMLSAATSRKKNQFNHQIKDIMSSCITHEQIFRKTRDYLVENSKQWTTSLSRETYMNLIQYCLIPRIIFSPSDALFSSRFLTETFSMDVLFNIMNTLIEAKFLHSLVFSSTISEAGNLGIFFCDLLESLERIRTADQLSTNQVNLLFKWHEIIVDEFIILVQEKNYMSIRNGIEFMRNMSELFPVVDVHIKLACKALEDILLEEKREDIKLPTNALFGHLNSRIKTAIKKVNYCGLSSEELTKEEKLKSEEEEIESYENMLENEKKQAELRAKIEENKQKRLQAEKEQAEKSSLEPEKLQEKNYRDTSKTTNQINSNKSQSTPSDWRMSKVFRVMDDAAYYLSRNDLYNASKLIENDSEQWNLKYATKSKNSATEFRSMIFDIFSRYFKSLVNYPNGSEFRGHMEDIRRATRYLEPENTRGQESDGGKSSRYGGASSTNSRINEQRNRQGNGEKERTNLNRGSNFNRDSGRQFKQSFQREDIVDKQRNQLRFPDKPSQQQRNEVQSKNLKRGFQGGPIKEEERPTKRFKKDEKRSYMDRDARTNQKPPQSRFGGPSTNQRDSSKSSLPQGPKAAKGSRYQR